MTTPILFAPRRIVPAAGKSLIRFGGTEGKEKKASIRGTIGGTFVEKPAPIPSKTLPKARSISSSVRRGSSRVSSIDDDEEIINRNVKNEQELELELELEEEEEGGGGLANTIPLLPKDLMTSTKRLIGEGSFGKVFILENRRNNSFVVAKQLVPKIGDDKTILKIKEEARLLSSLASRCTSTHLLCGGELYRDPLPSEGFWLITEYLKDYTTLEMVFQEDRLKPTTEWGTTLATKIAKQLMIAVDSIHRANIAHRDIKPENILVSRDFQEVKIIDFGEACDRKTSTKKTKIPIVMDTCQSSQIHGTKSYLAPEVVNFAPDDILIWNKSERANPRVTKLEFWQRADLWSLGLVLLELMIGRAQYRTEVLGITNPKGEVLQTLYTVYQWSQTGLSPEVWKRAIATKSKTGKSRNRFLTEYVQPLLSFSPASRVLILSN